MTVMNLKLKPGVGGKLVYYPGQLIKGTVKLNFDHPKKVRGLHVTIFGSARTRWTINAKNKEYFEGVEVYLNSRIYMFGERGGPNIEMSPKYYEFGFECLLPDQIPYTTILKHAEIKYYVKAVLDIPWKFDKESTIPITIIPNLDLNLYQHLKIPKNLETYEYTCSLFCGTGKILMTIHTPYSGFTAGQKVPIEINYDNKGSTNILHTKMILRRIIRYNAQEPYRETKIKEQDIYVVQSPGVKANNSISFKSTFEIPRLILCTNDMFCSVAQITYIMIIEAVLSGCNSNIKIAFPVVIGTNPIIEDPIIDNHLQEDQFDALSLSSFQPFSPVPDIEPVQPSAPDLPPSFEEATKVPSYEDAIRASARQTITLTENPMPAIIE